MKKFRALLCALALVACLAAPVFAEAVDLTNPVDIELMAYYVMDIPDDDVIMNYLEEKFNVNFDLKVTNIDNYDSTLNMRIASEDMPDWFRVRDNNLYVQLIEDGEAGLRSRGLLHHEPEHHLVEQQQGRSGAV